MDKVESNKSQDLAEGKECPKLDIKEELVTMDFSGALLALKAGKAVRRTTPSTTWFLTLQNHASIEGSLIPKMQSLNVDAKRLLMERSSNIMYENQILQVSASGRITYYIPTATDLFATDWIIVE